MADFDKVLTGKPGKYVVTLTHKDVSVEVDLTVVQEYVVRHLFDYNDDGFIDGMDYTIFLDYLSKNRTLTTEALYLSDANGDGYVDGMDLHEFLIYLSTPSMPLREVHIPIN
ncbi:MAG: dockerin type I repeat-containing protein [Coprobacillaceae bacterium]